MPELPEVETMRRGVAGVIGSRVSSIHRPRCTRRPIAIQPTFAALRRRLVDRDVVDVGRRGKRVVFEFCDRSRLVIEPRMTGIVLVADPPTPDHLRFEMRFDGGPHPRILFWDRRGLGTVSWYDHDTWRDAIDARLGVDAMDLTADALQTRLRSSGRAIKVALLDQAVVAGIGNMYAAEILFVAGVDPRTRCDRLTRPQYERIAAATTAVLGDAIRHEGSTLGDGTYRNALNDPGGYQNYHRVYDKRDQTCGRCGSGTIRRIVQCQRSTFFCPTCQRKRGRHHSLAD